MSRLSHLAVNDEGFVFDPYTGDSYLLNSTGQVILEGLIEDCTPEEVVQRVVSEFDVSEMAAERDVREFLTQLKTIRLLEEDA